MAVDIEDFEFAIAERFRHLLPREAANSARTPRELAAVLAPYSLGLESPVRGPRPAKAGILRAVCGNRRRLIISRPAT